MKEVARLKSDDIGVFDEVFHEYHKKLYYYVFSKTKSAYYAEEVVQLTFIKLWHCRHTLNDDIPLSSQIFRIAKTTLIDHLRKVDVSERLMGVLKLIHPSSDTNLGHEQVLQKDLQRKIEVIVSEMPPMRRKVFELSRFNGYTYKEISSQLFISVKTVENHINHALKYVRSYLGFFLILLLQIARHL